MRYILIIVLLLPFAAFGQQKYKTDFVNGIEGNFLFPQTKIGVNYVRNFNFNNSSFYSASLGIAHIYGFANIEGEPNPFGIQNSGLGFPMLVTYNQFIGRLDQNVLNKLQKKCIQRPSKFNIEVFLEGGGGITPFFFNKNNVKFHNGISLDGYLGIRGQFMFRRPFKNSDLIIFARGGIKPRYEIIYPPYNNIFPKPSFSTSIGINI